LYHPEARYSKKDGTVAQGMIVILKEGAMNVWVEGGKERKRK